MKTLFERLVKEHPDKFELSKPYNKHLYDACSVVPFAVAHDSFIAIYPYNTDYCFDSRITEYKDSKQLNYSHDINYDVPLEEANVTTYEELEKIALEHHDKVIKELKKLAKKERIRRIKEL